MKTIEYTRILIIVMIAFLFSNCTKEWLDIKADKTLAVPATLKDLQALMDNRGRMNGFVNPYGEVSSDGHHVLESIWNGTITNAARNAYTWSHNAPYERIHWTEMYYRVFTCNYVLEELEKINVTSTKDLQEANGIKGQALFNRACVFFYLSQIYAKPFNTQTANSDQGIAWRTSSDFSLPTKRITVKQTYDQIIADLGHASQLLPDLGVVPTRASKAAAYALLARAYLTMNDFNNAFIHVDKSLEIYNKLLDFSTINSAATSIGIFNIEVIFHDVLYSNTGLTNFLTTNYLIETDLYNQYVSNDLRRAIYFKNTANRITFKGNYNSSATELFCGIAVDELLLIRAECYVRKGDILLGMKDLNDLLRTRWAKNVDGTTKYIDQSALDETDALKKILIERRKELVLRGLRWGDLRRLNTDSRFAVTLTRTIGGKTYTLEPNSYKYTLPFPTEIIYQTGMSQTDGW